MACYKLLRAYQSYEKKTDSGKGKIFFSHKDAGFSGRVDLPCGQCIGCRIDRAKSWSLRCINEASLFEYNCFITLTFDDDNLNSQGSLVKSDFQKFMKRLRKRFKGFDRVVDDNGRVTYPIRYFHCGEYGAQLSRPHHHACIFNFDFLDKKLWSVRNGVRLYRSEILEELWPFGFCTVGDVTKESAAYVARYCIKKITGDDAATHYVKYDKEGRPYYIEPEYITMPRRPGIGKRWFDEFKNDLYPKDFVTEGGKIFRVPKYYDKLYDISQPEDFRKIRKKRLIKAKEFVDNNTDRRLDARRRVSEAKAKIRERSYENGFTNF